MPNCKVNVDAKANPLAHGIYQDLNKLGVSCEAMDQGYNVTNYAGKYCTDKTVRNCILSKGDGVVGSDEVLEYALNNYDKYRQVIEGRLGSPLPWVLDDLDPNTKFDAEIRAKVDAAIKELKKIITSKGITEGSPEYKEKLAAGLMWFVAAPTADAISRGSSWIQLLEDVMKNNGLKDFLKYLKLNGGFRFDGIDSEEYSALEAIAKKRGECTEISKILFAVLKMAELSPEFVREDIKKESIQDPFMRDLIAKTPEGMSHVCIGLNTGGGLRFLDPSLFNSDAHYAHYTPLSPRQYLSMDYSNRGNAWEEKGELDKAIGDYTKAIEVDPKFAGAYYNRGIAWAKKGEPDKAIADFTKAIEVDPKFAIAYNNRGLVWGAKGEPDKAIADYTKAIEVDPKCAMAYANRGIAWAKKGEPDKAIADYTKAIEVDPKLAGAYSNRGIAWAKKGELDKAIGDYTKAIEADPKFAGAYYNRGIAWVEKGELDKAIGDYTSAIDSDSKYVSAIGNRSVLRISVMDLKGASQDLSEFIKLTGESYDAMVKGLAKELTPHWEQKDVKPMADRFHNDTSEKIAEAIARMILCYASWLKGDEDEALENFSYLTTDLAPIQKPAPSTMEFLKKMLDAMPEDMKKDNRIKESIESLYQNNADQLPLFYVAPSFPFGGIFKFNF